MTFLSRILAKIGGRQAEEAQRHSGKVGDHPSGTEHSDSFFAGAAGEDPGHLDPGTHPPGDTGTGGPDAGSRER